MNLIPEIAKMLGVEIGEEFKLNWNGVEQNGIYRFTDYRFQSKFKNEDDWNDCSVLTELCNGEITIIKIPFEPKNGDRYFRIFIHSDGDINVCSDTWMDWTTDYMCKCCGNCFRTESEAEKHKFEIYEKLTGKKWEE